MSRFVFKQNETLSCIGSWRVGKRDQWSDCFGVACRPAMASMYSGVMEGSGEEVAAWLTSPAFESRLFTSFPCTNIIPSAANQVLHPSVAASLLPALCTSWSAFASFVAPLVPLLLLDLILILLIPPLAKQSLHFCFFRPCTSLFGSPWLMPLTCLISLNVLNAASNLLQSSPWII